MLGYRTQIRRKNTLVPIPVWFQVVEPFTQDWKCLLETHLPTRQFCPSQVTRILQGNFSRRLTCWSLTNSPWQKRTYSLRLIEPSKKSEVTQNPLEEWRCFWVVTGGRLYPWFQELTDHKLWMKPWKVGLILRFYINCVWWINIFHSLLQDKPWNTFGNSLNNFIWTRTCAY